MCFDGDGSVVWNETQRTAKKRWRCIECGVVIPPGTKYTEISGLPYDRDGWFTERTHTECMEMWKRVVKEVCDNQGMILLGGLGEEFDESGARHDIEAHEESKVDPEAYGGEVPLTRAAVLLIEWQGLQKKFEEAVAP